MTKKENNTINAERLRGSLLHLDSQMTVKELREALFYLRNQNMTAKELGEKLDRVKGQELAIGFTMWLAVESDVYG